MHANRILLQETSIPCSDVESESGRAHSAFLTIARPCYGPPTQLVQSSVPQVPFHRLRPHVAECLTQRRHPGRILVRYLTINERLHFSEHRAEALTFGKRSSFL